MQVVEPWHVAVLETAAAIRSGGPPHDAHLDGGLATSIVAVALTSGAVWLALHADLTLYSFNLAAGRARTALIDAAAALVGTAFGQGGLDALRSSGLRGLALGTGVMVVAAGGADLWFARRQASSLASWPGVARPCVLLSTRVPPAIPR